MVAVLMSVVVPARAAALDPSDASPTHAVTYDDQERAFLELINDYRAEHGRGALVLSDQLSLTAGRHAADMAKYDFFSHETKSSSYYPVGFHSWDRIKADGYLASHTTGENLAAGMAEAARALEAWSNSSSHNENMLDPGQGTSRSVWKAIGIARVENPDTGVWYWDTTFGTEVESAALVANEGDSPDTLDGTPSYGEAAQALVDQGIMDGYGDGSLGLSDPLLRQQFTKLILNALGRTPSEADVSSFVDVKVSGSEGLYPDNYVALAFDLGITKGIGLSHFAPWSNITRAQAMTMVARAARDLLPLQLESPPASFGSTWGEFSTNHADNVAALEYNGVLDGLPLTVLDPWAPMPRGEIALLLYNLTQ